VKVLIILGLSLVLLIALSVALVLIGPIFESSSNSGEKVLHLFEADVSEATVQAEVNSWEGDEKKAWCSFAYLGKESYLKSLELGDQKRERDGNFEVPLGATPKPGQRADSESRARLYQILWESCERDRIARESATP
jgi:hypothetical protein